MFTDVVMVDDKGVLKMRKLVGFRQCDALKASLNGSVDRSFDQCGGRSLIGRVQLVDHAAYHVERKSPPPQIIVDLLLSFEKIGFAIELRPPL